MASGLRDRCKLIADSLLNDYYSFMLVYIDGLVLWPMRVTVLTAYDQPCSSVAHKLFGCEGFEPGSYFELLALSVS